MGVPSRKNASFKEFIIYVLVFVVVVFQGDILVPIYRHERAKGLPRYSLVLWLHVSNNTLQFGHYIFSTGAVVEAYWTMVIKTVVDYIFFPI